jgi:hypothetical protein
MGTDRIQIIKEAAERLKTQKLETTAKQPLLPFEIKKLNKKNRSQSELRDGIDPAVYITKGGSRIHHPVYGCSPTMEVFLETHGMTSVEGDTRGYRHDY